MSFTTSLYTCSQLRQGLQALGVVAGQTLMLHASVKAIGPLMGGPNVILQAVLDALGPDGTLMMYAGWQDIPDHVLELPPADRQLYYDEHPPFDPATAHAVRENSVLAEFLRTWPGAARSLNPEASMVAVGSRARELTDNHPIQYGYGPGSPLARLVEWGGSVLVLGAPLDTITLLHYAENRAALRRKNIVHYQCPVLHTGQTIWIDVEDFDTGEPHDDYSFEQIAQEYLSMNRGQIGKVGDADCYLLDAADLTSFAIRWLEMHFGEA